jgi:hypothetical protein
VTVGSVLVDIVKGVIAELRGKHVADWTTDKVAAAIADKVKEAIAATIAAELRVYANALDLRMATDELADAASRLLIAMRESEGGGGLPRILDGAQIEYVHVPVVAGGACRNCGSSDPDATCTGPKP